MADNQNIRSALEGLGSFTQPQEPEAIPQEAPKPMMQEIPQGGPQGGPTPQPPAPTPAPALSPVQEAVIRTTEAEAAKPPELSPLQNILMATGLVEDQRPVEPVKDQGPYVPRPRTIEELTGRPEPLQSGIAGEVSSAVLGGFESANRQYVNTFSFFFPGIAEKLINQRDPDTGQPMRTLSTDPKDFVASPKTAAGRFTADLIGQAIAAYTLGLGGTALTAVKGTGTAAKVLRGTGAALSTEKAVGWEAKALAYLTSNGVENLFQDMVETRPDAVMSMETLFGLVPPEPVVRSILQVDTPEQLEAYVQRKVDVFVTGALVGSTASAALTGLTKGIAKLVTGSFLKRAPEVVEKFPQAFTDNNGQLIPVPASVTQRGNELISEGLDELMDARVKMTEPPKPPKPEVSGVEPPAPKAGEVGGTEPPAPPREPPAAEGPPPNEDWDKWRNKRAERTIDIVLKSLGKEDKNLPGLIKQYNLKLKELDDKARELGAVTVRDGREVPNVPYQLAHFETARIINELSTKFDELLEGIKSGKMEGVELPTIRRPDRVQVPITPEDFKKAVVILFRDTLESYSERFSDPMDLVRGLSRVKMPAFFAESPNEFGESGKAILALHEVFTKALDKFNSRDVAEVDRAMDLYLGKNPRVGSKTETSSQQLADALLGGAEQPSARVADHLVSMTVVKDVVAEVGKELADIDVLRADPQQIGSLFDRLIDAAKMIKTLKQRGAESVAEGRPPQVVGQLPIEKVTTDVQYELYGSSTPEVLNKRFTKMLEVAQQLEEKRAGFKLGQKTDEPAIDMAQRVVLGLTKKYGSIEAAAQNGTSFEKLTLAAATSVLGQAKSGRLPLFSTLASGVLEPYQRRVGDVVLRLARAGVLSNNDIDNIFKNVSNFQRLLEDSQHGFMAHALLTSEQEAALTRIQAINDIFRSKADVKDEIIPTGANIPSLVTGNTRLDAKWTVDDDGLLTPGIHTSLEHMSAIEAELDNILKMHEGDFKKPTFEAGSGREGGMFQGEARPVAEIIEDQNIKPGKQYSRFLDRFASGSLKARVLLSQLTVLYANSVGALIEEIGGALYGAGKFVGAGLKVQDMDVESRLALWRAKQTAGLSGALELAKVAFSRIIAKIPGYSDAAVPMTPKVRSMIDAFKAGRPAVTREQTLIEEAIARTQTARGVTEVDLRGKAAEGLPPPPEGTTILEKPTREETFLAGGPALETATEGTKLSKFGKFLSLPEKITNLGPKSMAFIDEFFKQRALEIEYKAAAISAFLKKHGTSKTFEQAEAFANNEWNAIYNKAVLQTEAELYKRAARNVEAIGKFNKERDTILYSLAVEIEFRRILTELNQNIDDVPEWFSSTTKQIRDAMDYQASTLDYKNNEAGALLKISRGGGGVAGMAAKTLIMFPQTAVNELVKAGDLFITPIRLIGGMPKVAGSVAEWDKVAANRVSPTVKELMHPDPAVRSRAKGRLTFAGILVGSSFGYGAYKRITEPSTVSEATGVELREPTEEERAKGLRIGTETPAVPLGPSVPTSERITSAQRRLQLTPGTVGTMAVPVLGAVYGAASELGALVAGAPLKAAQRTPELAFSTAAKIADATGQAPALRAALSGLSRLIDSARNGITAADKPGQFPEEGERLVLIADYIGSDDFTDPIKNALKNPENIPAEMARGMFSPALGGTPLLGMIVEMAGGYKYDNRAELDYFEGPEDESPVQRMIKIAADKGRVKRTKEGLKVQSPMLRDFMRSVLKYRGRDLLDAFGDGTDTQDPEANRAVFDGLVASGWAIESIPRLMSDPSYKSPNIGQIDLKKFKMADGRSAYEHIADFVAYGSKDFVGTQATNVAERNNPEGWIGGKFNKTLIQFMQDEFFAKLPPDWKASDFDLSLTARKDDAKYTRTKQQMDRLNLLLRSRYEVALRLIIDQSEVEKAEAAQKGITRKSLKSDFANIPGATR